MVKTLKQTGGLQLKLIFLIFSVLLCNFSTYSQNSTLFSFLKSQKTGKDNVSGEYVMNDYLTGNEDGWIESIECIHVNTQTTNSGIIMIANKDVKNDPLPYSEILINFNEDKLMKVNKILFYMNKVDSKVPDIDIIFNNQKIGINNFQSLRQAVSTATVNNIASSCIPCPTSEPIDDVPLKTLKIINYYDSMNSSDLQLLGFRVYYNGIAEDIVTSVEDLQVESNNVVEYYDMLGRKLSNEPVSGLFIMRRNGKTQKILK